MSVRWNNEHLGFNEHVLGMGSIAGVIGAVVRREAALQRFLVVLASPTQ
jgi:hypothetical protein